MPSAAEGPRDRALDFMQERVSHATDATPVACREQRSLGGLRAVHHRPRLRRLKCQLHMDVAIRLAVLLAVAAEVEIRRHRVAERPAAVIREQRFDGLSQGFGDVRCGFDAHGRG